MEINHSIRLSTQSTSVRLNDPDTRWAPSWVSNYKKSRVEAGSIIPRISCCTTHIIETLINDVIPNPSPPDDEECTNLGSVRGDTNK